MTNLPSFTHSSPLSCKCPAIAFRIFSNVFPEAWLLTNHAIRMGLLTNRTIVPHLYGKTRYTLFSHPSKHTNNYPPNKRGMFYINIFTPGSFPFFQ